MKNIIITGFIFTLGISLPVFSSEKSWLRTFTRSMNNRHTYEHNSFEQKRDAAILYLLPSGISQQILSQQRSNMQNFLEKMKQMRLQG